MKKKHVAIIRLSSLGDVVLSTVAVKILKPSFNITFITKKDFSQILEGLGTKIYTVQNSSLQELIKTALEIKSEFSPEFVLDLHDKLPSVVIRKILDPTGKRTVVWNTQRIKRRIGIITRDFSGVKHTAERFGDAARGLLKVAGYEGDNIPNPIFPEIQRPQRPDNSEILVFMRRKRRKKIVVVAPEASRRTKMWDIKEVRKLISELMNSSSRKLDVVTICKSEWIAHEVGGKFFRGTTLKDILYLIGNASVTVAMDSGIAHISMALGKPTVVVFTSSTPEMGFSPFGKAESKIVEPDTKLRCRPCSVHGKNTCPQTHFLCTKIDYRKVKEKIFEVLEEDV